MNKVGQIVAARKMGNWVVLETRHGLAADIADDIWYSERNPEGVGYAIAQVQANGQLDILSAGVFSARCGSTPKRFAAALVSPARV